MDAMLYGVKLLGNSYLSCSIFRRVRYIYMEWDMHEFWLQEVKLKT